MPKILRILVPLFFIGIIFFILFSRAGAANMPSPMEEVKRTVSNLQKIVSDPLLKGKAAEEKRRELISKEILSRIDFQEMAKNSLGKYWKGLDEKGREEYVKTFSGYVVAFYRKSVFETVEFADGGKIRYIKERINGEYAEVDIVVPSSPSDIGVIFRLRFVNGRWMAYDVVVEGISQVLNLRSQFYRVIESHSYQELLRRMRSKK